MTIEKNNEINYVDLFNEYYEDKRYIVSDIVFKESISKYIFILESPHNDEVKNGYPVAGKSGIDMGRFMGISINESFGRYVKFNLNKDISIINISKVPLQEINILDNKYKSLLNGVCKLIRSGYKTLLKHRYNESNLIEEKLLKDFKVRFNNINSDNRTKIIVCGKFAESYFNKIKEELILDGREILYVPHPSRHQWDNPKGDLLKLRNIFKYKQSNNKK